MTDIDIENYANRMQEVCRNLDETIKTIYGMIPCPYDSKDSCNVPIDVCKYANCPVMKEE